MTLVGIPTVPRFLASFSLRSGQREDCRLSETSVITTDPLREFELPRSLSMVKTCKVLGISRRTAYYWIQNGRLQTTRTPLGSQRVLMDSLKAAWTEKFQ